MVHCVSAGQTLARGGALLGRRIGNFFGVTDESQYGTSEQVGWNQISQASAEDHFSTGRRLSFRTPLAEEPPPDYPGRHPIPLQTFFESSEMCLQVLPLSPE